MKLRYLNNQLGSTLFELLVFLPLFLIFVVVVVDLGLAFQEHAALRNAQRALQNVAVARITAESISATSQNFETVFDPAAAQALLEDLLSQFEADIAAEKTVGDSSAPQYSAQAALLLLPIDRQTGEAQTLEVDQMVIAHSSIPLNTTALAASAIRNKHYVEPRAFISQFLSATADSGASLYARPMLAAVGDLEARFMPHSVLLYLEVSAEASGLKRFGVYSFLGRFFALQDQQLLVLRE